MTYDQAQSSRLGQRTSIEQPGVRLCTSTTLPEAPYTGQLIYRTDLLSLKVWNGVAWVDPGGGSTAPAGNKVTVASSAPSSPAAGDLWVDPTTQVISVYNSGWLVIWDPRVSALSATVTSVQTTANTALSTANTASTNASTALSTANTANTNASAALAASGTVPDNYVTTAKLAATAITSKHTLTNPTIAGATCSDNFNLGNFNITACNTGNFTSLATTTGNTYITMPEIRPVNCYVTAVPVVSGGNSVFMLSSGRLVVHTSARKYKKNIRALTTSVTAILGLEPVSYDYRKNVVTEDWETDGTNEIGFIADQAAELGLEHLVGRGEDGQIETFHYYKLPILQQIVIRDQQRQIDELRAEIEQIKAALQPLAPKPRVT